MIHTLAEQFIFTQLLNNKNVQLLEFVADAENNFT